MLHNIPLYGSVKLGAIIVAPQARKGLSMPTNVQDVIEREIIVKAPQDKVYQAITDPVEIIKWFPDTIEGSLAVGERPILGFGGHGKSQIYIEAAKPHDYFAYRWVPGSGGIIGDVLKVANTLVEFHILPVEEGTKIVVKESGFASLPAEVAEKSFMENSGGWEFMISRLGKQFA